MKEMHQEPRRHAGLFREMLAPAIFFMLLVLMVTSLATRPSTPPRDETIPVATFQDLKIYRVTADGESIFIVRSVDGISASWEKREGKSTRAMHSVTVEEPR